MEFETIETQACSGTVGGATRVQLCRMVFDAMLERDLLGVLLSPKHFRLFLSCFARHAPSDLLDLAQQIPMDAKAQGELHDLMLTMYSGIYIEECKLQSVDELIKALDAKCSDFLAQAEGADENLTWSKDVELAWRYRRSCESFKSPTW